MGYESKIFIVNVHRFKDNHVYAEIIAIMNMCKMETSFHNLFKTEIDYEIYAEDDNHTTSTDRYGEKIKFAPIDNVIKWLKSAIKKDDYRRLKPLLKLLTGFDEEKWDELQVIHYGY